MQRCSGRNASPTHQLPVSSAPAQHTTATPPSKKSKGLPPLPTLRTCSGKKADFPGPLQVSVPSRTSTTLVRSISPVTYAGNNKTCAKPATTANNKIPLQPDKKQSLRRNQALHQALANSDKHTRTVLPLDQRTESPSLILKRLQSIGKQYTGNGKNIPNQRPMRTYSKQNEPRPTSSRTSPHTPQPVTSVRSTIKKSSWIF